MSPQNAPPVLFHPDLQLTSSVLHLSGEEWHHARVLRLVEGNRIRLVNGSGLAAVADISLPGKKSGECRILSVEQVPPPPGSRMHVAMSTIRVSRMDYAVEKLAELGIGSLGFFHSDFTSVRIFKEKHWRQIAISAMKQSGQASLLQFYPPVPFENLLTRHSGLRHKFIAHPDTEAPSPSPPLSGMQNDGQLLILIGPEGGFSAGEARRACDCGFQPLNLGSTILRAETAAVVAAVRLLAELES